MRNSDIAIVGAGPAGAVLAAGCAAAGMRVLLFDHRAPWEKPCGGMLGPGAFEEFGFFREYPHPIYFSTALRCTGPRSNETIRPSERPFPVLSRHDLGEYLIDRAVRHGARFVSGRIVSLDRGKTGWSLGTGESTYAARLVAGADGVQSMVRTSVAAPIPRPHRSLCCGYTVQGARPEHPLIRCEDLRGYLWLFDRGTYQSTGILSRMGDLGARSLFARLDDFLAREHPSARAVSRYAALIPSVCDPAFFDLPCAGDDWLLVGDAAGHADPLTGEGIRYALAGAQCAAACLIGGKPRSYDESWRAAFGDLLRTKASQLARMDALAAAFGGEMYGALLYAHFAGEGA
ncbi:MAG: FAD-dependent monooxygenase [Spirochaetota bacterium]|nr:FAD-dependent monooxygenase [Spirochaetota bacterium]